jgi:peptidoglycan/xylan/chitin deacetylase (PgdA/CDA1 family)
LTYHDVVRSDLDESGFPGAAANRYKLPWATFVEHLDHIGDAVSGPPATAENLLAGEHDSRAWVLTFDDAGTSALVIGEELVRRGWRGHFFAATDLIGKEGFLDASGIRELHRLGHIVGSHSVSHPGQMASLPWEQLLREWRDSVAALTDVLGADVRTAAVPGGFYSKKVALAAERAGIAVLFTSEPVRTARAVGECLVVGRLSIRAGTGARDAARAAAGHSGTWLRQWIAWNVRKPIKAIGGEHYDRLRRGVFGLLERRPN